MGARKDRTELETTPPDEAGTFGPSLDVELPDITHSVVIARLIEEVRNGDIATAGYNRIYNRHNRS
jgi:hypothetical protein